MSNDHSHQTSAALDDGLTEEQRAEQAEDQKVALGVFVLLLVMTIVFVSGWSPQF